MITPRYFDVSVGELRKNPWNTNIVSPENELKIRNSIKRNGIFKPILVREIAGESGYEIIGGEHRWEQAVALGFTAVPVCNLGAISEKQAKEIGIIDNARYGADDSLGLAELLKEISDSIEDIQEFLPYGEADLDDLFGSMSAIDLDSLGIDDEAAETEAELLTELALPTPKPSKTHTIMRFKVSLGDAERLTALVAKTQKEQGLSGSEDLINAGDALVHLLSEHLSTSKAKSLEEQLDEAFKDETNE